MASVSLHYLTARKTPRQTRATVTLEAIFEATIQVLLTDGPSRLTTTRVAARAGVSVGTMYQYYPNKHALLYAVTERYFNSVAETVEKVCLDHYGLPLAKMSDALVDAYWHAKAARQEVTRALYLVADEVNTATLAEAFGQRIEAATAKMFASASDGAFADLAIVNLSILTTIFGTVRGLFTREISAEAAARISDQMRLMCRVYVEAVKMPI